MNKYDIFNILFDQDKKRRELFDMAYMWGRWNVKATYDDSPAFRNKLDEIIKGK